MDARPRPADAHHGTADRPLADAEFEVDGRDARQVEREPDIDLPLAIGDLRDGRDDVERRERGRERLRPGNRLVACRPEGDELREIDRQAAGGDGSEFAQRGGGRTAAGIIVA